MFYHYKKKKKKRILCDAKIRRKKINFVAKSRFFMTKICHINTQILSVKLFSSQPASVSYWLIITGIYYYESEGENAIDNMILQLWKNEVYQKIVSMRKKITLELGIVN